MKTLVCFFVLGVSSLSFSVKAQSRIVKQEPIRVTFYYNVVWELTTSENAVYRREAYFDLSDMVFDGVFSDYNKAGELIADGIYNHGVKSGIHSEYRDRTVKTKVEYSGNDFTIWEWNDGSGEGVKNGNGKFTTVIYYFTNIDGKIVARQGLLDGEFLRGRKTGRWIYHDNNKLKTDEEIYSNGKLLRHKRYHKHDSTESKEGKVIYLSLISLNTEILAFDKSAFSNLNQYFEKHVTYPSTFQRNITYPKGLKQLLTLLANTLMLPEKNLELLRLRVDEHGQITKSTMMRSINLTYDQLTDQVMQLHQDRFLPAMRSGKPLESIIYLPIAGGEEWMQTLQDTPIEWFLDYTNFY